MTPSEALGALGEVLRAAPRGAELAAVAESIASVLPREAEAPSAATLDRVKTMVLRSVVASTDGVLPLDVLPKVAALAASMWPARDRTRVLELAPPPVKHTLLIAARGVPSPRPVVRPPYLGGQAPLGPSGLASQDPANDAVTPTDEDMAEAEGASAPLAPPAATDLPPLDASELPGPARAPVTLVDPLPEPIFVGAFHERVVVDALDGMRGFAGDRWNAPVSERPYAEQRLLGAVDAIAVTPGPVVDRVLRAWRGGLELPGTWQSFAAGFTLGALEGGDVALALLDVAEAFPEGAAAHAMAAIDGFAVASHAGVAALGEDLLDSRSPVARAAGVRLVVRRRTFDVATLRGWLLDANLMIVREALRGLHALAPGEATPLLPVVGRWLGAAEPSLAWPAARALLLAGSLEPLHRLREGGPVVGALGLHALDVLVLAGEASDAALFATIAARHPTSRGLFDAIGRFGHLGAFARLTHALGDEDTCDAAWEALVTLLGTRVSREERFSAGAWRSALLATKPPAELRHRRGAPWSPAVIADECAGLSARAIEGRLDEIRVRAGVVVTADLESFWPVAGPSLEGALVTARREGRRYPAGSYHVL